MAEGREWEAAVQAAWVELRTRVADALADLGEGSCVLLEFGPELLEEYDEDECGAAPYVQATGWGEGMVRIEAVSNHYLDELFELAEGGVEALDDLGWFEPTFAPGEEDDGGSANFWFDLEWREADQGAVMLVETLRKVYGCLHPTFLATFGVHDDRDEDSADGADDERVEVADFDSLSLSWPSNRSELVTAVNETINALRGDVVDPDPDGDLPIRVGTSMVFVRVLSSRPAVEMFAELVIGLRKADPVALARELNILNRQHPDFTFYSVEGLVMMRQVLIGVPFVPLHLKIAVETFCGEIDDIARDLVERVGGRRFFESGPDVASAGNDAETAENDAEAEAGVVGDSALVALIEMLRDGRLPTRSVIELFDADRARLVAALTEVRRGLVLCDPVEPERVLDALRRATRTVTRSDAERSRMDHRPAETGRRLAVLDDEDRRPA